MNNRSVVLTCLFCLVTAVGLVACGDSGGTSTADVVSDGGGTGDSPDASVADTGPDVGEADDDAAAGADAPVSTWSTEPEPIQLTVGDLVFDALAAGPADGIGVLLLHGFPQTSHAYRRHITALAEAGYRAVAPDQRGYSPGARPEEVEAYALPLLVDDIIGMADALGFDQFHLVGHDWGAAVSWTLASLHADRLLTLNPVSVPHLDAFAAALADPDSDQADRSSYFALFSLPDSEDIFLADDAAQLRAVYAELAPEDIDAYVAALGTKAALGAALNWYRANSFDDAPDLGPITTPTMFIWGDSDTAVGPDAALLTEDFVDGPYRFETIVDGTHWLLDLNFDTVDTLLQGHFQGD